MKQCFLSEYIYIYIYIYILLRVWRIIVFRLGLGLLRPLPLVCLCLFLVFLSSVFPLHFWFSFDVFSRRWAQATLLVSPAPVPALGDFTPGWLHLFKLALSVLKRHMGDINAQDGLRWAPGGGDSLLVSPPSTSSVGPNWPKSVSAPFSQLNSTYIFEFR